MDKCETCKHCVNEYGVTFCWWYGVPLNKIIKTPCNNYDSREIKLIDIPPIDKKV